MKILLIRPKPKNYFFSGPHLGLHTIKSCLGINGFPNVKVLDIDTDNVSSFLDILKKEQPDVVGINCLTELRMMSLKLARIIKEYDKNIITVLGGIHASQFFHQIMNNYEFIDYIVVGEGEETFVELVDILKKYNVSRLDSVQGIAYRNNKKVEYSGDRQPIANLDDIPFADYGGVDFKVYDSLHPDYETLPVIWVASSRGCFGKCTFCSTTAFWSRNWRFRSANNIVDEIESLHKNLGVKTIKFADDVFTGNKQRIYDLCDEIIKRKLKIRMTCVTRVDCIDRALIEKMAQAGFSFIAPGIESGSERIQKSIKKYYRWDDMVNIFKWTKEFGVCSEMSLIAGNIGEDRGSMRDTKKLIRITKPQNFIVSLMTVYPATEVYEYCKSRGLVNDDFWLTENPRMLYSEISIKKQYQYQRQLYYAYMFTSFHAFFFTIKYALTVLVRDPRRVLGHFLSRFKYTSTKYSDTTLVQPHFRK